MRRMCYVLLLCPLIALAQSPTTLGGWAERLRLFGEKIQQEEVFVHMDNTCYYLGDTIYYKAYLRLSDGRPSPLSHLLYAELWNQDGYLVERQKVEMTAGQGWGSFCLPDTLYGGYYELRAYTRWQLNWGQTEHPHTRQAEDWFFSKEMAKEYYRDYEKLYSRVFPVYDHPRQPGDYAQEMTLRPLQRVVRQTEEEHHAMVRFYPEGGTLMAGSPGRVAFEATDEAGRHLKGKLRVQGSQFTVEAETVSRGRGSFVLSGEATAALAKSSMKATFEWEGGTEHFALPHAVAEGVAMQATTEADGIHVALHRAGSAAQEELGLTASCHGILKDFQTFSGNEVLVPLDKLPTGVVQLTVFNAEGRIYADRLIFVRQPDFQPQHIAFSGLKDQYEPYEEVNLTLTLSPLGIPKGDAWPVQEGEGTIPSSPSGEAGRGVISLAVRDAAHSDYTLDSGNILTEMLLASQIRGFVEQPEYYFEVDDEPHRQALDLLLMVQGWRRYEWKSMTTPGGFALREPYEHTEVLTGQVLPFQAEEQADLVERANRLMAFIESENNMETTLQERVSSPELVSMEERNIVRLTDDAFQAMRGYTNLWGTSRQASADELDTRTTAADGGSLKREVRLHAEFVQPGVKNGSVEGDMETFSQGRFRIEAPRFYEACHFSLAASDTTHWKPGKTHIWVATNEDSKGRLNYPEFYVRLSHPHPRFVKPYSFYQTAIPQTPPSTQRGRITDEIVVLDEITVGARRNTMRRFDASKPALALDALDAFNQTIDAGLCPGYYTGARRFIDDVARTFVGDMGMERAYEIRTRLDTVPLGVNLHLLPMGELLQSRLDESVSAHLLNALDKAPTIPAQTKDKYDHLPNLDMVYVYTDYAPRREGDTRYRQANQPTVTVDLRRMPDEGQRMTWRDRRMVLRGFSVCEDFYQPDYSRQRPAAPTDYRRTLYWNPNVKLDGEGRATVRFFNNSQNTQLAVSAEGMTTDGQPLTGRK